MPFNAQRVPQDPDRPGGHGRFHEPTHRGWTRCVRSTAFRCGRLAAQILRGAALAGLGRHAEAQRWTDQGLQAWRDTGTLLTFTHALATAARVQLHGGRLDSALQLAEALEIVARTGERWYEPELHRLQGS